MKNISLQSFFINYIQFAAILVLIYFVLGTNGATSLPFLLIFGLTVTAVIVFTGLDKKLKKHLP